MGQFHIAVFLCSRSVLSSLFLVPIIFLGLVFLSVEFSSAQEDEGTVELCTPASTVIIASDGGVVDISALDESEVARVTGAKGSTDSIIAELKKLCGFSSFILLDGNGSSGSNNSRAISQRVSDKVTDPVADAMLEACNSSVAILEVRKDDICVDVPECGVDQGFVWTDDNGYLWSGGYGYLWSGIYITPDTKASPWLEGKASPWLEGRASPWLEGRSNPWFDQKASPWLELNASPWISLNNVCIDDLGYLWSGNYGYLWSGSYGYLWSGAYGYLWSGVYNPSSNDSKASPWLENSGVPWVD